MQSEPSSGIKLTAYSCICWLFHRIERILYNSLYRSPLVLHFTFVLYYISSSIFCTLQYDLYQKLQLHFDVLLMMGNIDTRNMQSNFAVNKHLHTVASFWILLIQSHDARNHEYIKKIINERLYSCLTHPACMQHLFCVVLYRRLWSVCLYHIFPHNSINGATSLKKVY